VLQVSALAVGLLALVLLVLLRTDLISSWRKATPPDAPNRFRHQSATRARPGLPGSAARAPVSSSTTGFP
jgi:predicted lysophospholipase L1 biosynthesis ABC-type transport system permease subunit